MDQNLLTNSDLNVDNNLDGEYEFLKALGLIEDEVKINAINANDEESVTDDDDESYDDADDDDDEWWDFSKPYTGWDYIVHFGEDAWDIVYQARLAHHRNIVLREFTRRLPNLSEQVRNGLFDAFSISKEFGVEEHNALLDALADPVKGWNLNEY